MIYTFDTLSVGQYQRLIQLGESPEAYQVAEALTGKKKNQLTVKDIEGIKVGSLNPPEIVSLDKMLVHDGIPYGRVNMETLSYGEFVDLLDYAKDLNQNLIDVVALLYRPIVKFKGKANWKIKFGEYLVNRGLTKRGLKLLDSVEYELEEYDPVKCDARRKAIKEFPAYTAHWAVTFFLNFLRQLENDSLRSSLQYQKETLEMMKESMKEITSTEGSPKKT